MVLNGYHLNEMPSQHESTNDLPSFDDQDYRPHLVPRKSPLKEKYGKLGSLYNPNNVDPRTIKIDSRLSNPAGVNTNYGIGDS